VTYHERRDDDAEPRLEQGELGVAGVQHLVHPHDAEGEQCADAKGDGRRHPRCTGGPGRRRGRARLLVAVTIAVGALAAATGWLFVWPPTDPPGRVDAVLVLAGGKGERETTGVRLVQQGVAPVIVFSDGGRPDSGSARLCQQRFARIRVVCLHPRVGSTRGEARAFSELAAREGWRSVAVVTSSYHIRRASLLIDRCYEGTVHPVAAGLGARHDLEPVRSVLREAVGFLVVSTTARGC
jgi:uncharacterized SAM-binding protein YcdF (DUF218 family)